MTRDRRWLHSTLLAATVVAVLTAGCSGTPQARPAPTPAPSVAADTESPAEPSPAGTATDAATTTPSSAPEPGSMQTPGRTSGELSRRDFPRPQALGGQWRYAVDSGDAEEGYVGNGTPALARSPREIVQTAVPFGCPRPARMPLPEHALEVDYTAGGTAVIAIRSQFADTASARTFFDARRDNLDACVGRGAGAVGPLVTDLRPVGRGALLNGRTQRSDPWMELAVLDGDSVVLLASQNRAGRPPLDPATAPRLAAAFRAR
jgi:hypothetical protein